LTVELFDEESKLLALYTKNVAKNTKKKDALGRSKFQSSDDLQKPARLIVAINKLENRIPLMEPLFNIIHKVSNPFKNWAESKIFFLYKKNFIYLFHHNLND
jgi:hypothetical protein